MTSLSPVTPCINLIPAPRRRSWLVRQRIRAWAMCSGGLAAASLVAVLAMVAAAQNTHLAESTPIREAIDRANTDLSLARADDAALTRRLAVATRLTKHPDWSVLLDAIAGVRPGSVVFEHVELRVSPAPVTVKGVPAEPTATVRITGLAASQIDAADFAVALQELHLFSTVSPAETRARPAPGTKPGDAGASLVSFTVTAVMNGTTRAGGKS